MKLRSILSSFSGRSLDAVAVQDFVHNMHNLFIKMQENLQNYIVILISLRAKLCMYSSRFASS